MSVGSSHSANRLMAFVPLAFGILGLLIAAAYEAQREGFFLHSFYSFHRAIQHHLDAIGEIASTADLLGAVTGLILLRVRGSDRVATLGTVFSVLVLLLSMFFLSL